jgi:outer membrane protein OmpA-like peptidoglycan-associated protein
MKTSLKLPNIRSTLVAAAVASILAACATTPMKPSAAAEARARLTQLQGDPALANRAPIAIQAADTAVRVAEQPETDQDLIAYRVYMADRKVDIARAQAETRLAEDQRAALSAQRDKARLDARTREVDVARGEVLTARAEGAEQKLAADAARGDANAANVAAASSNQQAVEARSEADSANMAAASSNQSALNAHMEADSANLAAANSKQQASDAQNQADSANLAAANSKQQATELQQQIDTLQARVTDRGLVVTLGDVLFPTGGSVLKENASGNLNRLVVFLDRYPDRTAAIEGYTDSTGTVEYNDALSRRRADAVMSYLVAQGVASGRLTASGKGESLPVAGNDSAFGRQQNRRVEVIINNPTTASR